MIDHREYPEWLQREADEIDRLARRERRRVRFWRAAILAAFSAGAFLGLRAVAALF